MLPQFGFTSQGGSNPNICRTGRCPSTPLPRMLGFESHEGDVRTKRMTQAFTKLPLSSLAIRPSRFVLLFVSRKYWNRKMLADNIKIEECFWEIWWRTFSAWCIVRPEDPLIHTTWNVIIYSDDNSLHKLQNAGYAHLDRFPERAIICCRLPFFAMSDFQKIVDQQQ